MKKKIGIALLLTAVFLVYTLIVLLVDVQPIGPSGSSVGLAGFNGLFTYARSELWNRLSSVVMYLAFACAAGELAWSWKQKKLDWAFGCVCALVVVLYVFFDLVVINCRPILVDGVLKPSYPSTHTMVICTIFGMIAAKNRKLLWLLLAAAAGTVMRCLSGMHWASDILGGVLLSAALIMWYRVLLDRFSGSMNVNS